MTLRCLLNPWRFKIEWYPFHSVAREKIIFSTFFHMISVNHRENEYVTFKFNPH
ncbi:hypothetical protein AC16_5076 [Escherichia coli 2-177-06_S3_C2]|nr:hypothetical protein AC16_5076 [Escherichia coli 2-177-06_S3_C2]